MFQTKRKINNGTMMGAVIVGLVFILIAATALIGIIATLISGEYIAYDVLDYIAPIISFVAVLLGCYLTGRISPEKKALSCCVAAAVYFTIIAGVGILFFDGLGGRLIFGILACVLGCAVSILLTIKEKQGRRQSKRSKLHR